MTRYVMAALVWMMAAPGWAQDRPMAMLRFIDRDVMTWVNDARLLGALTDAPLAVQAGNPAHVVLQGHLQDAAGRISAISLRDLDGMTVAERRSGDAVADLVRNCLRQHYEAAPWQFEIFDASGDPDEAERAQAVFSLTDPSNGRVIGTLIVELDGAAFF